MALIHWDDETLSVGIELLDNQHKVLVDYINTLAQLVNLGALNEDVNILFNQLVDYTQYHFNAEEKYFETLNKDELVLHKLQHKHFIEQLHVLRKKDNLQVTSDLLEFLLDWLVIHIQCEDRNFIHYNASTVTL